MSGYRYQAAAADGRVLRGSVDAASLAEATAVLLERGLSPLVLTATQAQVTRGRRVPVRQLALLFRSLNVLLESGLPLERSLAATEPVVSAALRLVLQGARARLSQGESLAQALGGPTSPIPAPVLALLRAGERAGRLTQSLEIVAVSLEQEAELRERLQGALAYPMVLAFAGSISLGLITVVVIPRFAAMLQDMGQALPPATAALLAASAFVGTWWPFALAAMAVGAMTFVSWKRSERGARQWHDWLLLLPGIGGIRMKLGAASMLRAMAAALGAGMPLVPALGVARDATTDSALAARVQAASEQLLQGAPLAKSLGDAQAVPSLVVQLLGIGESSGHLGAMAERAATLLSRDAERQLHGIVRLLEPALIVAFGGAIALVAGALLQAMYSMRPAGM